MATTTLGALVELIDANSTALGVDDSGGLWVAEVPEDKALPLLAVLHQGETPGWTFEKSYTEATTVEIHALAVGLAATETLALAVKALLDRNDFRPPLSVTNAALIRCRRLSYQVSLAQFRDNLGRLVFDAVTTYEIEIRRNLAR